MVTARSVGARRMYPVSTTGLTLGLTDKQKLRIAKSEKQRQETRQRMRHLAQEAILERRKLRLFGEQQPAPVPGSGSVYTPYPAGNPDVDAAVSGDEPAEVKRIADALRWIRPGKRVSLERRPLKAI